MAEIKLSKTDRYLISRDENGNVQGEYKRWFPDGTLHHHSFYVNNNRHGELKQWNIWGELIVHDIYFNGISLNINLPIILSNKDKFILSLKYGDINWLP